MVCGTFFGVVCGSRFVVGDFQTEYRQETGGEQAGGQAEKKPGTGLAQSASVRAKMGSCLASSSFEDDDFELVI